MRAARGIWLILLVHVMDVFFFELCLNVNNINIHVSISESDFTHQ